MDFAKALSITAIAGLSSAVIGTLATPQGVAAFTISGGGYTATDTIPYSFTDISKTGTELFTNLTNKDNVGTTADIGFKFNFFGKNYSQLGVSSNGLLTFGGINTRANNLNLKTQAPKLPILAVLWDDWDIGTSGGVFTQTQQVNDQQAFIVQWNNMTNKKTGTGNLSTFQAVLFASGNIQLSYNNLVKGIDKNTRSATVGIANGRGGRDDRNDDDRGDSRFKRLQWSYNTPFSTYQTSILFKQKYQQNSY